MHNYFVSYAVTRDGKIALHQREALLGKEIRTFEEVRALERTISKDWMGADITILGYSLLIGR